MDRKDFFKKAGGIGIGSCVGFSLLSTAKVHLVIANEYCQLNRLPVPPDCQP